MKTLLISSWLILSSNLILAQQWSTSGPDIYNSNPAKESFTITSENQLTDVLLQLLDLSGKAVPIETEEMNIYSKKVSVKGLAKGVYILRISSKKVNESAKIIFD